MKNFMRFCFMSILVTGMFIYAGCGGDGGGGTSNFGSKADADAALAQSTAQINLAVNDAMNVVDIAGSFGLGKALAYTYDDATGWWSDVYSSSSGGYTYNFDYRHRFTPRDANGYATEATDVMEYAYDYSYFYNQTGYIYDLSYVSDINCSGITGYRAGTGNLTVNGTSAIDYNFDFSYASTTYNYIWSYDYKYTNVAFSQTETYPVSGSISFTSKFSITPEVPGYENYNVAGKITFTGGSTATLEFGGYTYTINLATGTIS